MLPFNYCINQLVAFYAIVMLFSIGIVILNDALFTFNVL